MSAQRQEPIDFAAEGLRLALPVDRNCGIQAGVDPTQEGKPTSEFFLKRWVFRLSCENRSRRLHRGSAIGRISHNFKAEAQRTPRKEFLIKKFSDLCELGASVVNPVFIENPE